MELLGVRVEGAGQHTGGHPARDRRAHQRLLPIFIGGPEASAIHSALEGIEPPRPLTHDLAVTVIAGPGRHARAGGHHRSPRAHVSTPNCTSRTDRRADRSCRAVRRDAIALAVRTDAPIFARRRCSTRPQSRRSPTPTTRTRKDDPRRVSRLHRGRSTPTTSPADRLTPRRARRCVLDCDRRRLYDASLTYTRRNYSACCQQQVGGSSDERGWDTAAHKAAQIVGITYRQLDYWARTDLVRPSLADASGSGSRRQYSLPRPARAEGRQEPARRRHQARVGPRGLRATCASTSTTDIASRAPRHQRRQRVCSATATS